MASGGLATVALRASVDLDSTAVLAFDDGTRIPCVRFLLRTFCGVIRRLMEDSECEADERGRTVVPVPCQASEPYWAATDLLHGVRGAWTMDLAEVVGVSACMEFLGATAHDMALDARLWQLVKDEPLEALLPHAPRLLRNPALSALAVRRLIQLRPLWADFAADVLGRLDADRQTDHHIVHAVVAYAPNFFPPVPVVDWALGHATSMEAAMRLAGQHGVLYHPGEAPLVMTRLADMAAARWPATGDLVSLLRSLAMSLDTFMAVPLSAAKAHGSVVKFHEVPHASVCVTFEYCQNLPPVLRLTHWLKLHLCEDGRFDAVFKPRRIDETSRACRHMQVRVMAHDRRDPCKGRSAEAWYLFEGISSDAPDDDLHAYTLAHAASTLGKPAEVAHMVRLRTVRCLRLDFFYGTHSVLDNPFDPMSATRAVASVAAPAV